MPGNGGVYAVRKRRKPAQNTVKRAALEGVKSNPSKRHRDRLNGELDTLMSLLPFSEEVKRRLDKLSVLRLSVGYLKAKSFLNVAPSGEDRSTHGRGGNGMKTTSVDGVSFSEGSLLLQALHGFVLVVSSDGSITYVTPSIQDHLGFHQSDVVHQSVFDLIHIDDRATFRCQLHFAVSQEDCGGVKSSCEGTSNSCENYNLQHHLPENSSFLERSFCCRFRCLLDTSSGFVALNFQGRLKYILGQDQTGRGGPAEQFQLALFAIATPVLPPAILEIRSKTLIFQTRHKLDFAPTGIDARGKIVLGYSETELCFRTSGYQFIHAADMMYCADNHLRMVKTGESGLSVFRLLTKNGDWIWVQANARVVLKDGKPDFIIASQKALTNKEGEEYSRQRRLDRPFTFSSGDALLYDVGPRLGPPEGQGTTSEPLGAVNKLDAGVDPDSLLGSLLRQDSSVYMPPPETDPQLCLDRAFMDSHALLSVPSNSWQQSSRTPSNRQASTAQAMMNTLEQILGTNGTGSTLQDLELDQAELQEWERILLRMHVEGGGQPVQLSGISANDVFTYVEEALQRENGCPVPSERRDLEAVSRLNAQNAVASRCVPTEHPGGVCPHNAGFGHPDAHCGAWRNTDASLVNGLGSGVQSVLWGRNGDVPHGLLSPGSHETFCVPSHPHGHRADQTLQHHTAQSMDSTPHMPSGFSHVGQQQFFTSCSQSPFPEQDQAPPAQNFPFPLPLHPEQHLHVALPNGRPSARDARLRHVPHCPPAAQGFPPTPQGGT